MLRFTLIALLIIFNSKLIDSGKPRDSTRSFNDPFSKEAVFENARKTEKNVASFSSENLLIRNSKSASSWNSGTQPSFQTIPDHVYKPSSLALRGKQGLSSSQVRISNLTEDESLEGLVKAIIKKDLENCDLIIAADTSFRGSRVLKTLVEVPVVKQVVYVESSEDLAQKIEWRSPRCQGTFLLVTEPEPLITFGNSYRFRWAYDAKVVIIGLTVESLDMFAKTTKGQKTENIIGIVKDKNNHKFKIFMNLLFWGDGFKQVSNWWGENFANEAELFPDKISDLRGGVVKVFMLEFEPGMFVQRDSGGMIVERHGRDIAVVDALSQVFNFTLVYVDIPQDWGTLLPNGSFTGLVGYFERDEGQMGIANLFPSALDDRHLFQDYSTTVHEDRACFMARVEPPLPRWQNPSLPFQATTWLAMFVGLICSGPLLYLVAVASGDNDREDPSYKSLVTSCFFAFAIHVDVSLEAVPKCPSTQIFLVFLMLYGLVFTTGYTANLTAFLTVTRQPKSVETVREIYDAGWKVVGVPWYQAAFRHSENPYLRGLLDRFEPSGEFLDSKDEILAGGTTMISSSNFLQVYYSVTTSPRGKPLLRFLKECLSSFSVTIGFPVNSPLKQRFNSILSRMFESGLVERWYIQANEKYIKMKLSEVEEYGAEDWYSSADGVIALGMDHMQGIFIVYLVGFLLCKLTFVIEVLSHKCRQRWS